MSRIQQQRRNAFEELIAGAAELNPKSQHGYLQLRAAFRNAMGAVKNHQELGSSNSQDEAYRLLKFHRALCGGIKEHKKKHEATPPLW